MTRMPAQPTGPTPRGRVGPHRGQRSSGRVLVGSLTASALIHAVFLWLVGGALPTVDRAGGGAAATGSRPPSSALRLLKITPLAETRSELAVPPSGAAAAALEGMARAQARSEAIPSPPVPRGTPPDPGAPGLAGGPLDRGDPSAYGEAVPGGPGTRASRGLATERPSRVDALAPEPSDPRLWRPVRAPGRSYAAGAAAPPHRVDPPVSGDAATAADAGAFAAWAREDAAGHTWGASSGALHLAGLTVPLCGGRFDAGSCGFGVAPGRREAYRGALRRAAALRIQADRAIVRARADSLRARRDAARDSVRVPWQR